MHLIDLDARRHARQVVDSLERERAVLFAREARAIREMVALWADDQGGLVMELAGTARTGQHRATGNADRAVQLVERFPVALSLLETGVMRVGTAELLVELTRKCSHDVQRVLDARLSERVCCLDAVDVRRLVVATIHEVEAELDEAAQRDRFEQARADRGVWVFPVEDGMARVGAEIDQLAARRWALDFAELVRAQKVLDDRAGVKRTKAQREADVFASLPSRVLGLAQAAAKGELPDLLPDSASALPFEDPDRPSRDELVQELLSLPVRNHVTLNVHIPMTTLLDLDQRSGWVEGLGPVPALHARMLVAVASLRRVAVDERTGVPLGVDPLTGARPPWDGEYDGPHRGRHRRRGRSPAAGPDAATVRHRLLEMLGPPMYVTDRAEPQHDPSARLRALVQLRDQACDGHGCPRAASACEVDHEDAWADGGQTAAWNLRDRSTRCHHGKHAGWTVTHDLETAVTTWLSPSGGVYERASVWQPPTPLPDDVVLPAPRLVAPLDLPRSGLFQDDEDRPLWREPEPPPSSGEPKPPSAPAPASWDDGPPPF